MATVTFDTLKFVETLKEASIPEPQVKAFSTAVQESHEAADLATKTDLCHEMKELELRIDTRFEHIDIRFEKMHGEMLLLKWMPGLLIASVASLVLKAFFGA